MLKGMRSSWEPAEYLYYMLSSGKPRGRISFRLFAAFGALVGFELAAFFCVFPLKPGLELLPRSTLPFLAALAGAVDVALSGVIYFKLIPACIPERSAPVDHEARRELVGLAYFCRASLRFLLPLPFAAEGLLTAAAGLAWGHALMTGLLALFFLLCHGAFLARLGKLIRSSVSSGQTHSTDIFG